MVCLTKCSIQNIQPQTKKFTQFNKKGTTENKKGKISIQQKIINREHQIAHTRNIREI